MRIRPVTADDFAELQRLRAERLGTAEPWASRFGWQYRDNPMRLAEHPLGWVIDLADGSLGGHHLSMPHRFRVFGLEQYVGIATDAYVSRSLRGRGLGRDLYRHYFEHHRDCLAVCTSANELGERLWQQRGASAIGDLRNEYIVVYGGSALLAALLRSRVPTVAVWAPWLAWIGNIPAALSALRRAPPPATIRVELVEADDPRLDDLWERYRDVYPITVVRDRRYRLWRYAQIPEPKPRQWLVTDSASGHAVSFGLQERRRADLCVYELIDVFGPVGDSRFERGVIAQVMATARELGADLLRAKGLHPRWRRQLRQLGAFRHALRTCPFMYLDSGSLDAERLAMPETWHVTAADGDLLLD